MYSPKYFPMESGCYMEENTRKKSEKRLSKAANANTDAAKKGRKILKFKKTTKDQKVKDSEGVTYSAGTV